MWSVIGGSRRRPLPVTTGVTCPTMRIHPAVSPRPRRQRRHARGRFSFGVGSGEALNEHILGDHWPEADVRLEMLEEAIEVIRLLWEGGQRSHHGDYTVENARIYDLPDEPPPVLVSASARRRSSWPRASATGSARPAGQGRDQRTEPRAAGRSRR